MYGYSAAVFALLMSDGCLGSLGDSQVYTSDVYISTTMNTPMRALSVTFLRSSGSLARIGLLDPNAWVSLGKGCHVITRQAVPAVHAVGSHYSSSKRWKDTFCYNVTWVLRKSTLVSESFNNSHTASEEKAGRQCILMFFLFLLVTRSRKRHAFAR